MAWWHALSEFLNKEGLEGGPPAKPVNIKDAVRRIFITKSIDMMFWILGGFTHAYYWSTMFLFFSERGGNYHAAIGIMEALSEPYLGALGVYVILKEIRKRKIILESRHYGEVFVWLWILLFIPTAALVYFTPHYKFDEIMKLIITNTLASAIIFAASRISKP